MQKLVKQTIYIVGEQHELVMGLNEAAVFIHRTGPEKIEEMGISIQTKMFTISITTAYINEADDDQADEHGGHP